MGFLTFVPRLPPRIKRQGGLESFAVGGIFWCIAAMLMSDYITTKVNP